MTEASRPDPFPSRLRGVALLVAALAAFVWFSSAGLPPVVASHFNFAGVADGFMPRHIYRAVFVGFTLFMPLLLAVLPLAFMRGEARLLNIPHRAYWLAPERREQTIAFLRMHHLRMAVVLALLLAYVHWLVVKANSVQPPMLSTPAFLAGLGVFLVCTVAWMVVLLRRFPRP